MATAQITTPQILPTMGDPSKIPGLMEFWNGRLEDLKQYELQVEACYDERGERDMRNLLRRLRRDIRRAEKVLNSLEVPAPERQAQRRSASKKPSQGERYPHRHRRTRDHVGPKAKNDAELRRRGERAARNMRRNKIGKIHGVLAFAS